VQRRPGDDTLDLHAVRQPRAAQRRHDGDDAWHDIVTVMEHRARELTERVVEAAGQPGAAVPLQRQWPQADEPRAA
jgi:hypothetical protein